MSAFVDESTAHWGEQVNALIETRSPLDVLAGGRRKRLSGQVLLSEDRKRCGQFLAHCKIAQHLPCVTVLEVRHPKSTSHILQKRGTPNAQHPEECRPERAYVPPEENRRVH
jgi:hypothetical protein